MNHPELLLVPALMLSDYYLAVAGARLREGGHAEHFRAQHYEMNPLWQKAIARRRWFNPWHLLAVAVVTFLVFDVANLSTDPADPIPPGLFGLVIGLQGMINGRHLCNLATFAYVRRHPDAVNGAVTFGHEFVLRISLFQSFTVLVPLALLAAIDPAPAIFGATLGVATLIPLHLIWIARFRARSAQLAAAAAGGDSSSTASGTSLPPASSSANSPP